MNIAVHYRQKASDRNASDRGFYVRDEAHPGTLISASPLTSWYYPGISIQKRRGKQPLLHQQTVQSCQNLTDEHGCPGVLYDRLQAQQG